MPSVSVSVLFLASLFIFYSTEFVFFHAMLFGTPSTNQRTIAGCESWNIVHLFTDK